MKAILITILCVMFFIIVSLMNYSVSKKDKKKRIKYNVRSKLTFNKEETNVINFKQKKEAGN